MNPELVAALSLFPEATDARYVEGALAITAWCSQNGARILYPGHEDYPFDARWMGRVPQFVSYLGHAAWRSLPGLAVVGSRDPSRSALQWMESHLPEFIRKTGAMIISGGARGIDQKAHALALRAGRPTIVFLPSGLARPYPDEWEEWKDHVIASGGAIISTHAPFQEIRRSHFESRNRLIAGLARMLFVVEARRKSGSSMTARLAKDIDRTVCVLPAAPGDARAAGTVDLLFDGALPIRDSSDLEVLFQMCTIEGGERVSARRDAD